MVPDLGREFNEVISEIKSFFSSNSFKNVRGHAVCLFLNNINDKFIINFGKNDVWQIAYNKNLCYLFIDMQFFINLNLWNNFEKHYGTKLGL